MSKNYTIIDIETTGLKAGHARITEIAIITHDGNNALSEFHSLINPEIRIPYQITQLTGINDQMVAGAPRFFEIAKEIVELTEGTVIVGHNVNFDYSFLKAEFKSLGYDFQRKTLDTVRLARKLIPGLPGYSLGKLCNALNISHESRHRAYGDARATAKLFELLYSIDNELDELSLKKLNSDLNRSLIDELPESKGVYYFYDRSGKLIYVGKSINIKARVMQHLNNGTTKKAIEMKNAIADISFTPTGSELIALLLESDEIKKHKPIYNRSQKRSLFNYGLYQYLDEKGYLRLKIAKTIEEIPAEYAYNSQAEAREHLFMLTDSHRLCQRLNGLYPGSGACFHFHIGQCNGACTEAENPANYNLRVLEALEKYQFEQQSFYVFDQGPTDELTSVVKVQNGVYIGFGFAPSEQVGNDLSVADDYIKRYSDNRDVRQIIRSYLRHHKNCRVYPVSET